MNTTFRFLDFRIYQDAQDLHSKITNLIHERLERQFIIKDQLFRASLSIVLNIAEGSGRNSDPDFRRFLMISIASVYEVIACLDVLHRSENISDDEFQEFLSSYESLRNQIGGFAKSLTSG